MNEKESVSVFDLENLNPGVWFDMDDGGRVCLRVCAGDDYKAIRKQVVRKKPEYKNNQRFIVEDIDEDLQSKLLWDFCIVDWENILDKNKNPIPCTTEYKMILMGKSVKFSKFVTDKFIELADMAVEIGEERTKN